MEWKQILKDNIKKNSEELFCKNKGENSKLLELRNKPYMFIFTYDELY